MVVEMEHVATVDRTAADERNLRRSEEVETLDAELAAILVDLEARARYGKIEGLALPLLKRAKDVNQRVQSLLPRLDTRVAPRMASDADRLAAQLNTVERALTELSSQR